DRIAVLEVTTDPDGSPVHALKGYYFFTSANQGLFHYHDGECASDAPLTGFKRTGSAPSARSASPVTTAALIVRSNVADDTWYLNDQAMGATGPQAHSVPPGVHRVRITKAGYRAAPLEEEIKLAAGERRTVSARLEPERQREALRVARTNPVTNGLIAHWPFDGSAEDTSGRGHHGTNHGAIPTEDRFGIPGAALSFNGRSDYISVPSHPDFNLGGDYSFSLWINQRSAQPGGFRLIDKATAGRCDGWNLDTYDSAPGRSGRAIRMNVGCPWSTSATTHALDEWNHIAVSVKDRKATFFLNGRANGSGAVAGTPRNTLDLFIGSAHYSAHFFQGKMDDVRIYNRALSEAEIQQLYRESDGRTPD
ncbi:MAG: PEGA domain-containing protein, partial [Gammaproteobacteria bacterium]|nr:PEGA domain-containing protein [Gammaproteobacteria bacterium]